MLRIGRALLAALMVVVPAAAQGNPPFEPRLDVGLTLQDLPPGYRVLPTRPPANAFDASSRYYARDASPEGRSFLWSTALGTSDPRVASGIVPFMAQRLSE